VNLLNQGFLLVKLKSSLRQFYDRHHGWPLWNICITNDHGYVPLAAKTPRSFPHSWLFTVFSVLLLYTILITPLVSPNSSCDNNVVLYFLSILSAQWSYLILKCIVPCTYTINLRFSFWQSKPLTIFTNLFRTLDFLDKDILITCFSQILALSVPDVCYPTISSCELYDI
jgi:hypothetical protein